MPGECAFKHANKVFAQLVQGYYIVAEDKGTTAFLDETLPEVLARPVRFEQGVLTLITGLPVQPVFETPQTIRAADYGARWLLAGDPETGVTIMQMDVGLDTGAMLHKSRVTIEAQETRISLEQKLTEAGTAALVSALNSLETLQAEAQTQDDSLSTYASKIEKSEALIDWTLPAAQIDLLVRASVGRNPAYTLLDGERVRLLETEVLAEETAGDSTGDTTDEKTNGGLIVAADKHSFSVACGACLLRVTRVQLPGKAAMAVRDVRNARPDTFAPGLVFSPELTQE